MKTININQLQAQISRVMKDVEGGEAYEVMRYSRPIAIIRSKKPVEEPAKVRCDECIAKVEKLLEIVQSNHS